MRKLLRVLADYMSQDAQSMRMHPDFYRDYFLRVTDWVELVGRYGPLPDTIRVRVWGGMSRAQIEEAIVKALIER